MHLPALDRPQRYRGLYVFDFGDWSAVGYTAEEIALLLESEQFRTGKVYKIVRVSPEGQMELRGVAATTFQLESGMLFNRDELAAAQADFAALQALADRQAPPCRCYTHLADRGTHTAVARYVTALIYPGEYEDEMGRWLLDAKYAGGDTVEGGPSHVTNYQHEPRQILARAQFASASAIPAREREDVYGNVRRAVQR
jgi:hypothetical protein